MRIWPYKIVTRDDEDIKNDLFQIINHFQTNNVTFDTIVFVPNAGYYLSNLFVQEFKDLFDINFVVVRRASTVAKDNWIKKIVFKRRWLSNIMRHFEVLFRLIKYKLGLSFKRIVQQTIDFDVIGKRVLVIDDSVDTGTTLDIVKSLLLEKGADFVATACISNHLVPEQVHVDYSVYKYALLRTKNSRDYYAV